MKTIKIGDNVLKFYDNPETMPMRRYQRFNKFLMMHNEIGSDFADFNKRSLKTIDYLKKGMLSEAVKELDNRRLLVFNSFMEYSPIGQALAILVHSINGKEKKGITSEDLEEVISELEGIGFTKGQTDKVVHEVKKKIETELKRYYPKEFNNRSEVNYNVDLINLMKEELNCIINDIEESKRTKEIEKRLLQMEGQNIWNVNQKGNMEVQMETDFEKFLISVSEHTKEDINKITVFRFYALIEFIKEKNINR